MYKYMMCLCVFARATHNILLWLIHASLYSPEGHISFACWIIKIKNIAHPSAAGHMPAVVRKCSPSEIVLTVRCAKLLRSLLFLNTCNTRLVHAYTTQILHVQRTYCIAMHNFTFICIWMSSVKMNAKTIASMATEAAVVSNGDISVNSQYYLHRICGVLVFPAWCINKYRMSTEVMIL